MPAPDVPPPDVPADQAPPTAAGAAAPRPRRRALSVLAVALCAVLGLAIATQVQERRSGDHLDSARASDLVVLLDTLNKREADLRVEVDALERTLAGLRSAGSDSSVALEDTRGRLAAVAVQLGVVPVRGPGVVLTVADPRGGVGSEVLLDLLQELRAAGAEAVEVADGATAVRIGVDSWVAGRARSLDVDGQQLRAPLRVTAVGDPPTLAAALGIPGGAVDTVARAGGSLGVEQAPEVVVNSVRELIPARVARPGR